MFILMILAALLMGGIDCETCTTPKKAALDACRSLGTHEARRACIVAYKATCEGKER